MQKDYDLHDIIEMKKPHACQTNRWQIIRMGMDIRIKMLSLRTYCDLNPA